MVSVAAEYRSRRKRLAIIGTLLTCSLVAVIWSGLSYRGAAGKLDETRLEEEKLSRQLERQRQARNELDTDQIRLNMARIREHLVQDPAEFPAFLDNLQQLGLKTGVQIAYAVGEPRLSEFDGAIGWRDLELNFREVDYPQLTSFTRSLYRLSDQWLVEINGVKLAEGKGDYLLTGRFALRLWTQQGGTEMPGAQDSKEPVDAGGLTD